MELRKIYGHFAGGMSHEEFCDFTDSRNEVGKLLQSHFIALQLIMAPISKIALGEERLLWLENGEDKSTPCWLRTMHLNIPQHMLDYYAWPISVEKNCQAQTVC